LLLALCSSPSILLLTLSLTLDHLLPLCASPLLLLLTLNLTLLHLRLALNVALLLPLNVLHLTLLLALSVLHLTLRLRLLPYLLMTLAATAVTATLLMSRRPSAAIATTATFISFPLCERRSDEYHRDREHRNKSHKNKIRPHIFHSLSENHKKTQFVIPSRLQSPFRVESDAFSCEVKKCKERYRVPKRQYPVPGSIFEGKYGHNADRTGPQQDRPVH
jgi:hypothetical protein